jgi:hypothetical protein
VCARAGVSFLRLRALRVEDDGRARLARAAEELEGAPLFIHDASELSAADLAEHVRRAVRVRGVRLLVVDGLGALHAEGTHANRGERVAALTTELAALAAELGIAVLASVDAPVFPMAAAVAHRALALEAGSGPDIARLRLPGAHPRVFDLRFDRESLRFEGG